MITTEGKTLQQVSDEIAAKLIAQRKPCMLENPERCVYGDKNGNHCAVGWLLPENNPELMGSSSGVKSLTTKVQRGLIHLGKNQKFIIKHADALSVMQSLHDIKDPASRQYSADQLTQEHGLDMAAWQPWINMEKTA